MNIKEIINEFEAKPYLIRMGKGSLSKRLKATTSDILKAKKEFYNRSKPTKREPRILVLDIETAPMKAYVFNLWKQDVGIEKLIDDWYMICWSAKWLFDNKVLGDVLNSDEAKAQDDRRITLSLSKLLDEADIVITHNGKRFDLPRINARMLIHQLRPVTPYQNIDTCEIAKRQFGFSSNKLDFLARVLGMDTKLKTDFQLWSDCMEGKQEALDYMYKYNNWDVEVLEAVYLRLRPWIKNHPNLSLYYECDEPICPNCGSPHLTAKGFYYTSANKYQVYQCECGAISRVRTSAIHPDVKGLILNNNLQ